MGKRRERHPEEKAASSIETRKANGGRAPAHRDDVEEARDDVAERMHDRNDAADVALAAVDELADQATEIEALKQELEETRERLLRSAAEFQNFRKRSQQEKAQLVELGKSVVIRQFLEVLDDFRRSIEAADAVQVEEDAVTQAYSALRQGVDLIYRKFMDQLAKHGVEPIEAVGMPFDESEHEAMLQRETEGAAPGIVVAELQKGYRMGERVLRHARVVVAS